MSTAYFFKAFIQAISWNAFFYVLYKFFFVTLTFLLYKKLPALYFNEWALINSIIFLLLLWLQCGLKKSIPRFAPLFTTNKPFYKKFIQYVLIAKTIILSFGIPLLYYALHYVTHNLINPVYIFILFVSEGIASLFLLFYHAHFLQKEFNLMQTFFLLLEMCINFICIFYYCTTYESFLVCLFVSKIIANIGISTTAFFKSSWLYKKMPDMPREPFSKTIETAAFLKHSLIMWFIDIVQSCSERNFLFPCISYIQGISVANLFKIAHDAALFFQRIPLKTIGIADTTLFACIEISDNKAAHIKSAFMLLYKTIFILSVPLLCVGIFIFLKNQTALSSELLLIFFVITVCSVIELFLSPYMRILEIKLYYKPLLLAYFLYAISFLLLIFLFIKAYVSLLIFIICTHAVRIFSMLYMTFVAQKKYHLLQS